MANQFLNIPVVKTLDPAVNINEPKVYSFESGCTSVINRNLNANSSSNNVISFSYKPAQTELISRQMYIKYALRIPFAGSVTTPATVLLNEGYNGLRALPLQSQSNNINLRINGCSIQQSNLDQTLQTLMRFQNFSSIGQDFSTTPSMPDVLQDYGQYATQGNVKNPLSAFAAVDSQTCPRGSFAWLNIINNTSTAAVVEVTVVEPLFLPVSLFGNDAKGPAFVSVQDLALDINLDGLNRCWSVDTVNSGVTITSVNAVISQSAGAPFEPILQFQSITADPAQIPIELGKEYLYPYNQLQVNTYDYASSVPSLGTTSTAINSIQYNQVPKQIYVFVKERLSDQQSIAAPAYKAWRSCDVTQGIKKISVSINGQASLLAEMSQEQLYQQFARKNGYRGSYLEWKKFSGSVLCMNLGTSDLPLPSDLAPGCVSSFNFQINDLQIENISPNTLNLTAVIVAVFEGVLIIKDSSAFLQTGLLSRTDALSAQIVQDEKDANVSMLGGSFFGKLKSGISKALPFVKPISSVAKFLMPPLSAPLGLVGLGKKGKKGRGLRGMGLNGGAIHSNDSEEDEADTEELYKNLNKVRL